MHIIWPSSGDPGRPAITVTLRGIEGGAKAGPAPRRLAAKSGEGAGFFLSFFTSGSPFALAGFYFAELQFCWVCTYFSGENFVFNRPFARGEANLGPRGEGKCGTRSTTNTKVWCKKFCICVLTFDACYLE